MGPVLVVQALLTLLYLVGYLVLSMRYQRRWDAPLRRWLGGRLGVPVGWTHHSGYADVLGDDSSPGFYGWGAADGARIGQRLAVRSVDLVVGTVLGAGPVVVYILLAFFARLVHPLVAGLALFLMIPIFGLYWAGHYRWHGPPRRTPR